jgi:hypothetical protein
MSTRTMALVWPLQLPLVAKSVLVSLADNANDAGECWPSISTICERTCAGRTAVIDAIQWLEKNNFLVADRENGRHTKYQITIPSADLFEGAKPVRETNRSASRTGPSPEPVCAKNDQNQSASRTGPVRQADTNRKEEQKKKKEIAQRFDFSSWPSQPSPQVLADWLTLRKRKRADVSETVIRQMAKQLVKAKDAGWTVDDALAECVMRGWQGFNAEWLGAKGAITGKQPTRNAPGATDLDYLMAVGK